MLKDFLESRGVTNLYGTRDVTRAAFQRDLLNDGPIWMAMIESRHLTSHTYDEAVAQRVLSAIRGEYASQFEALGRRMQQILETEVGS